MLCLFWMENFGDEMKIWKRIEENRIFFFGGSFNWKLIFNILIHMYALGIHTLFDDRY